jgi:hypothetical protein
MPQVYPLGQPQFAVDPSSGKLVELPGLLLPGSTLGELLEELERNTGAWVIPDAPPKYFRYFASRQATEYELVDIHVEREGQSICAKQDLSFALLPSDKVVPGLLAC